MKQKLFFGIALLFAAASSLYATPSLGVATDTFLYAYTGGQSPNDAYINYFANNLIPAVNGGEGFAVGPSGSHLVVFTDYRPDQTPLYLLSNTGNDNAPLSFGGTTLAYMGAIGQIDGYVNPAGVYYGMQLPSLLSAWSTHTFDSNTYYLYDAALQYAGDLSLNDYFFAVADINGTVGLDFGSGQKDGFSPKTSSAIGGYAPVPEPASLLLMSLGLAGGLCRSLRRSRS